MMIRKSHLKAAKAYLCWDKFQDLAIQLIPISDAIAYFLPPNQDFKTIYVFYKAELSDCSNAFLLLFHEAGHFVQFQTLAQQSSRDNFIRLMNLDKCLEKVNFEREAWTHGRQLLRDFLQSSQMEPTDAVLRQYDALTQTSLESYQAP